jgi:hypothetical protein
MADERDHQPEKAKKAVPRHSESPALPLSGCASGFHWELGFTHFWMTILTSIVRFSSGDQTINPAAASKSSSPGMLAMIDDLQAR